MVCVAQPLPAVLLHALVSLLHSQEWLCHTDKPVRITFTTKGHFAFVDFPPAVKKRLIALESAG
jgi:hypothetical protein